MATDNDRYAAAVGMFDGLHAGHLFVLGKLRELAESRRLRPMVISFANHPTEVLSPADAPGLISGPAEKEKLIRALTGIERIEIMPFTTGFAAMTAARFLSHLKSRGVDVLAMGFNNHIGSDRLTATEAAALGIIEIVAMPPSPESNDLSSSALRRAIAGADFATAAAILSRPYSIEGTVVPGRQLGRKIGYPTANIEIEDAPRRLLPPDGVYAADVTVDHDPTAHRAMVNIGRRPTVDNSAEPLRTIEAHILNFSADLYSRRLTLTFLRRLRDERRFSSLEALTAQLALDAEAARSTEPILRTSANVSG